MDEIKIGNVSIGQYGQYKSGNYGINAIVVEIGELSLYFSYKTVVAIGYPGALIVSENLWGPTTGKHLNWIDGGGKGSRVKRERFEAILSETLEKYGLA